MRCAFSLASACTTCASTFHALHSLCRHSHSPMEAAFALDGHNEIRRDCELAEAMGDCGIVDGAALATGGTREAGASSAAGSSDEAVSDEAEASSPPPRSPPSARPRRREPSSRGPVADVVSQIFQNVYQKIETSEVLAGLGQLRVMHGPPRHGRTSQGAVHKERKIINGKRPAVSKHRESHGHPEQEGAVSF